MRIRHTFIPLAICIATISATTRPADDQGSPPALALFVQAAPARLGKPLSLVFEVKNQGHSKMELDHVIGCGRVFSDHPGDADKQVGFGGNGMWYDNGETCRVQFRVSSPLPKDGLQMLMDLRIYGGPGEPTFIQPGKSFLYRLDLPADWRLQGSCEIYFTLIQKKHELARSETAKIEVAQTE